MQCTYIYFNSYICSPSPFLYCNSYMEAVSAFKNNSLKIVNNNPK